MIYQLPGTIPVHLEQCLLRANPAFFHHHHILESMIRLHSQRMIQIAVRYGGPYNRLPKEKESLGNCLDARFQLKLNMNAKTNLQHPLKISYPGDRRKWTIL